MAKKFLTPLGLVRLASDPATGSEGELYFNTTDNIVKLYIDGQWVPLDTTASIAGSENINTTYNSASNIYTVSTKNDLVNISSISGIETLAFNTTPDQVGSEPGTLSWNENDGTLNVKLTEDVTLQVGQELHVRAHNNSGSTIYNGTVCYVNGVSDTHGHISVAPYIADGSVNVFNVMGLATADILNGQDGYVTLSGLVRGLDTSMYTAGDSVFASDTIPGGLTTTQPLSPSETVSLGVVTVSDSTNGTIFVQIDTGATADLVTYDNTTSLITATNVQSAIDELAYTKADVNSLTSNIVLYPTTASATGISGYYRMVSSIDDAAYDDTAVNIPTGNLDATGQDHLIASLSADASLFVGSPGSINITTIGNIRKTSGNANAYSEFFFKLYHRESNGTELLIGTSSTTGAVNPTILNQYAQFSAAGNFLLSDFSETDRLVIKYFSNTMNPGTQTYEFQFGGIQPVRTLLPVPISVTPASNASGTLVNTSTFNGVLSGSDSTVQHALETIDDIVTIPDQTGHSGQFLQTTGTSLQWQSVDLSSAIITASAAAVSYLVDGAPGALDTLNELAAALDDNADILDTLLTQSSASTTYLTKTDASATYIPLSASSTLGGSDIIYSETQPDTTGLEIGTMWVDSDGEITGGGGGGGTGLSYWSEDGSGNLIPDSAGTQNIGSPSYPINHIYASSSSLYLGDSKLSINNNNELVIGTKTVLDQASASTIYATKIEVNNIDLSAAINTASAAAASYTDSQLSTIDLSSAITTASAAAVNYLVDGAPGALDTLNELSAALNDNANILDTLLTTTAASSTYLPLTASASFYRWTKTYSASASVISGVDDNSISLSYNAGYVQLFINGVMLDPSEYTATDGSTITVNSPVLSGEVVDIFAFLNSTSVNTYSQAQIDAKYNTRTRWTKTYSASATVISGNDDNSLPLLYSSGFEEVFLNGILLTPIIDYARTSSSVITLTQAVVTNDIIDVVNTQPFNVADVYTTTQSDNRYLTQSSASTTYLTQSNGITAATASATYIPQSSPVTSYKNKLINGEFDIWQRGTSFSTSNAYTADRWVIVGASGQTVSVSQQSFTPGAAPVSGYEGTFFARLAWSGTPSGTYWFTQRVEDVRTLAGQTVTLSFWAKASSTTSAFTPMFEQNFGTGGSSIVGTTGSAITITTSWQRFTQTFSIPSISGKTIGTSSYLEVRPLVGSTAVTGNNIDIWGVQVENGNIATQFEQRFIGDELRLCERYYEISSGGGYIGNSANGSFYGFQCNFRIVKRVSPVVTRISTVGSGNVNTPYAENVNQYGFRAMAQATNTNANWSSNYSAEAEL